MAGNSNRQSQRQESKARKAKAATVMASELLTMTPEDLETRAINEVDGNPALEKGREAGMVDEGVEGGESAQRQVVRNISYGVSEKVIKRFEHQAASEETLIEHMEEQINSSTLDDRQRLIASYIVGSLDRNGYFRDDPYALADDISFKESIDVDEDEVLEVLGHIQQMDPVGIGARDLRECLLLQLAQRNTRYTRTARRIVDECFKDFVSNRPDRIASTLGISQDELSEVLLKEIRKLDPKPGGAYDTSDTDFMLQVTPTFVINVDDEQISYEIPNRVPELYVSGAYIEAFDMLDGKEKLSDSDREVRDSIKKNIDNADIFVSALQMRQETLKQTIEAILKLQHDYFINNGDPTCLRPMKLKDLERITGRNASVLSRATSGKYMSTPWGLVKVRDLFSESSRQVNADGEEEEISTRQIKARLQQLVDDEDKTKPLSDDKLAQLLQAEGYSIARRTVGKYREQLNIPTKNMRREFKQ